MDREIGGAGYNDDVACDHGPDAGTSVDIIPPERLRPYIRHRERKGAGHWIVEQDNQNRQLGEVMETVVMARKKDEFGQKAGRRIRRWIIKKTLQFLYSILVLTLMILGILFLVTGIEIDEILRVFVNGSKQIGNVLLSSMLNTTVGG